MNCREINTRAQSGAALVVAMLVFALCTALIVAMKSEFDLYYQRGANGVISEQIYAYLRGAEELGSLVLIQDYDEDQLRELPRDDLDELWAQETVPQSLPEGGWWWGELEDLQGRFNLNTLEVRADPAVGSQKAGNRFTVAQQQFIRLLKALEEIELSQQDAILITESIGDWQDADSQPRPNGAEDDYYLGKTPAYRAGNRLMSSVSELRLVAYMTPEIYEALLPWVTVLPKTDSRLNILTAPPMVLRSINADDTLQPLSVEDGLELELHRKSGEIGSVEDFFQHPVFEGKTTTKIMQELGLSSSYFLLSAEAKVADRTLRLYSVLERRDRLILALGRASGSL